MLADPAEARLPRRLEGAIRTVKTGRGGVERRAMHRARSLLSGKMLVGNGAISSDCTIRDLSVSGARARISKAIGLPRDVMLLAIRDGLLFDATVIWRRGDELGLRFVKRMDLRRDTDPARRGVRALWTTLSPR